MLDITGKTLAMVGLQRRDLTLPIIGGNIFILYKQAKNFYNWLNDNIDADPYTQEYKNFVANEKWKSNCQYVYGIAESIAQTAVQVMAFEALSCMTKREHDEYSTNSDRNIFGSVMLLTSGIMAVYGLGIKLSSWVGGTDRERQINLVVPPPITVSSFAQRYQETQAQRSESDLGVNL